MSYANPETRQRILDAARQIFSGKGYRETRITEIARLADVSPATIYSYFSGKQDLFQALDMEPDKSPGPAFERKRAHILQCACHLFGERGFHGTTIESVARRAGYSKAGLYQFFPSKEALFEAVIHETAFHSDMLKQPPDGPENCTLPQALQRISLSFLRMFDDPDRAAIFRLVIAESVHYPEIGEIYHTKGIGFVMEQVASCLRGFQEDAGLGDINFLYAARAYMSMFFYAVQLKVAPGNVEAPTDEEVAEILTNWFLNGLLPR